MLRWLTSVGILILALVAGLPAAPALAQPGPLCFDQTKQCIEGRFRVYWEQNGGLAVFGYPITPARPEANRDTGQTYLTQWFERNRFELHPENQAPYDVLLGRLGDDRLRQRGINWQNLPAAQGPQANCLWFAQTRHNVCDQAGGRGFRTSWSTQGLLAPGLDAYGRSLALFGLPLTEPRQETNTAGDTVLTQWFERARFEWHPDKPDEFKVLLGLLGNEVRGGGIAPVTTLVPGTYTIRQKSNGRFLDAHESAVQDFRLVTRPGQPNNTQRWVFGQVGVTVYTIRQVSSGRFVDAHQDAAHDFSVVTRPGQPNNTQRWMVLPVGDGSFTIQQLSNGRFLDAHESAVQDFRLVTRPGQPNNTQRWLLYPLPG